MRYFFHVYDGYSGLDVEGSEFPNWSSARLAAVRFAGEIIKEEPSRVLSRSDWRMEVTDETGLVLMRLDFCATESAAVTAPLRPSLSAEARF